MDFTDIDLENFRKTPKHVTNRPKEHSLQGRTEIDYLLTDGDGNKYSLYFRQNERIKNNFSCGLLLMLESGEKVTLARYNGNDHTHFNPLEKTRFSNQCHIHRATERYMAIGRKSEKYAETTTRYSTIKGALHCLVVDYHIVGITTEAEQPELF